ncbi:dihydroorotate dehydrogenase electron transfer subunit [Sediminibacillus albus]|uniref:Dihydroorotate dehydrogenase B (NAD(+)), electron transfer subunit n=1 Tax=Sediminibacillus albus TaxID=407036 RepID=A0A1G8W7X3_9BACI|nr:dihydroorotate dehydrogenase electron transfer subunit [Sediminibacillus albus]SDJ73610.1 dihydroorotate dehydrogenase electron transfer subunit [Sediminibacillus albus]
MNRQLLTVTRINEIAEETVEMVLQASTTSGMADISVIQPGQFLHIKVGDGSAHMLRRPISVADVDKSGKVIIIFKITGEGTKHLSQWREGSELDVLIPCGTGYPIEELQMERALLIGGGIGVPPLYYLGKVLKEKGVNIYSVLGFQTKAHVFYQQQFNKLGETIMVTDDGSFGEKGLVTEHLSKVTNDFDYFFTCGPAGMLRAVSSRLADKQGYISVEQRMGCGIGACYACVIPSTAGDGSLKKICKDGPVFPAKEVVL